MVNQIRKDNFTLTESWDKVQILLSFVIISRSLEREAFDLTSWKHFEGKESWLRLSFCIFFHLKIPKISFQILTFFVLDNLKIKFSQKKIIFIFHHLVFRKYYWGKILCERLDTFLIVNTKNSNIFCRVFKLKNLLRKILEC